MNIEYTKIEPNRTYQMNVHMSQTLILDSLLVFLVKEYEAKI